MKRKRKRKKKNYLKKVFPIMLMLLATIFIYAYNGEEDIPEARDYHGWIDLSASLIAHGGGAVGGFLTTNVKEAVIENYKAGHRVFELDFNLTTDGRLAAVHDWPSYRGPLSSEEFSKILIADRYPSMEFRDFCELLLEYPDMYIVTDTKSFDYTDAQITQQFEEIYNICAELDLELLDRIIPQIYNRKMYDIINAVFPFKSVIYTLYESPDTNDEVVEFVSNKDAIKVITMAPVRLDPFFLSKLRRCGKVVYCFTLNDLDEMKLLKSKGVNGFYTDFVLPSDFELNYTDMR